MDDTNMQNGIIYRCFSFLGASILLINGLLSQTYYGFDDLNRLIKINYASNIEFEYCYDALGNRTCRFVSGNVNQSIDLTPTNGELSSVTTSIGATISATYNNENLGTSNSGGFTTHLVLSTDEIYDETDIILRSVQTPNLAGGAMPQVSHDIDIPNDIVTGNYKILVIVDPDNLITELSDANNQLTLDLTVQDCMELTFNTTAISASCGQMNGSATVNVGSGTMFYTYLWNTIPEQTTATATNLAGGSYMVTVTDENGCIGTNEVTVGGGTSEPTANFSYQLGEDLTVNFTSTAIEADTHFWTFGTGDQSTAVNPIYTYAQEGNYTVCLEVTNVCGSGNICQSITVSEDICEVPYGINITNTTQNSVTLTWQGAGALWDVQYREPDAPSWTSVGNITNRSITIVGLTANTGYEVRIATLCGDVNSAYSDPITFFTPTGGGGNENLFLKQSLNILSKKFVPNGIAELPGGDFLIVGEEESSGSKIKAIRITSSGSIIWAKEFDNLPTTSRPKVTVSDNAAYIIGTVNGLPRVSKIDFQGSYIWSKEYDVSNAGEARGIVTLQNGDIAFVAEQYTSDQAAVVVIIDADGHPVISRRFYESGSDIEPIDMALNPATGNIGVCGVFDGNGSNDEIGGNDIFFLRLSPSNLSLINSGWFGSTGDDWVTDVEFEGNNRPILTGTTNARGVNEPFMVRGRHDAGTEGVSFIYNNNQYTSLNGAAFIGFPFHVVMVGSKPNPNDNDPAGVIIDNSTTGSGIDADWIDIFSDREEMTSVIKSSDNNVVAAGIVQNGFDYALYFTKYNDNPPDFGCIENNLSMSSSQVSWNSESGMQQQTTTATTSDFSLTSSNMTWAHQGLCCNATAAIENTISTLCFTESLLLHSSSSGYDSLAWTNSSTGEYLGSSPTLLFSGNAPGENSIRLEAFDGNCSTSESISIIVYAEPNYTLHTIDEQCGGQDGLASITLPEGSTVIWSTGSIDTLITGLTAGSYSVEITDNNGCTTFENFTIDNTSDGFTVSAEIEQISCNGATDGSIALTPSGEQSPITVNWADSATDLTRQNLNPDEYNVTITDGAGCEFSKTYDIEEPPIIAASAVENDNTACEAPYNGLIQTEVVGGTPPYSYAWDMVNETGPNLAGLQTYSGDVTITDANGCVDVVQMLSVNDLGGSCPTCDDGMQNGDEIGIDCGGSECLPCNPKIIVYDSIVQRGTPAFIKIDLAEFPSGILYIDGQVFSPLTITTDSIEIISDIPTVHYLSLVIDGEEVDRAFIQHLSCNWESFSLASTDTIMHESCHTIKNGIGYVPPILIDSESESSFYTRFVEIEKYGISADTLDLTVQLKNHPSEGGNACLAAEIVVYGSEQAVRFIIADEYCIQNQGGYLRPSAFTTVSTAGLSMLEWQNIQCRVNGDSIKLITNGISFSSSLQSNMGELLGVAVDFQGSGSIDNLLIDATDMGNGYYEERFDECNCQGDTIVTQPTLISLKKNELRIAYPQNLHPNATTNNWLTVFGDLTGKYPGSTRRDGNQLVFLANRNFLAGEELHITSLDSIQFLDHTNSEPFVWKVIAPVTHQTQGRFFLKPLGVQVPDGALDYGYDFRTADFNIEIRYPFGHRYKPVSGGSGGGGTNILIYLQNSNGGYQAPDLYFNFWNYSSFDGTPDLNGDGYPDLMIRHNIISSAMVRLNDGTGHFSSGQYFNVRNFSNGLVYGDIDSDGDLDILSPSGYSPISGNATSILRNNGSAQFSESLFGPRLFNSSRHLADLDKDGDLDFIFTSNDAFNSPKKLQVYSNNGLGQFSLSYDQNNPEQITIAQVVDFNGDGKQDLFSTSPFEGIIYGDGSLDYDLDALISLDSLRTTSVIIDVNGDQRYDILTPRIYDGSSWLSYPLKAKIKDDDQQLIVWQGVDTLLREARHAVDFDMDGDIDHLTIDAEGNIFLLENVDSKIYLNIRVALAGPYDANSGLMNDNLRALGLLPEVDPYGFDCQRVQPGVLDIADTTAIVDWVLLELRPETDVDEILFRQSALIRRDGYIVGMDGKSPIQFDQLIPAGYHIVVKHRNHLAVMTEAPFTVSLRDIITVNFLDQLTPTYGVAAQYIQSDSKATMYSGDAVPDGQVNAVDKNAVWRLTNGLPFNYRQSSADFNLDGTTNAVDANAHWRIHNSRSSNINY